MIDKNLSLHTVQTMHITDYKRGKATEFLQEVKFYF